ncbi:MAG TPA: DUF5017 domain-containing protein [Puia sp.]|jgi:hypothetical protein|nr:DUF5017 domain-containing protein [Puia sp.]
MSKLFFSVLLALLIGACNSKDVASADFTVTPATATYKAGDTAWFYFKGNPYNLTFYSGEPGHDYQYRMRTQAMGRDVLQFNSATVSSTLPAGLQVLVSTDFTGEYDSAGVANPNVHWTDITSRAKLATGTTSTASGQVDISDFIAAAKPLFLAFRYTAAKTTTAQRTWTVTSLAINNIIGDSTYIFPVATIADGGWTVINMDSTAVKWTVSSAQLQVKGGAANSPATENWVVSRGVDLGRALPDAGVPVKNISNNKVVSYFHIYTQPGTYTASFAGTNTTIYDSKSSLRQVQVNITQ